MGLTIQHRVLVHACMHACAQTELMQEVRSLYRAACAAHGVHVDPRVVDALASACRGAPPTLTLSALTLSDHDAAPLVAAVARCGHLRSELCVRPMAVHI